MTVDSLQHQQDLSAFRLRIVVIQRAVEPHGSSEAACGQHYEHHGIVAAWTVARGRRLTRRRPCGDIKAPDWLAVLRRIEDRGALENGPPHDADLRLGLPLRRLFGVNYLCRWASRIFAG